MSKQRGIGQRGGSRLIGSAIICLLAGYALAQAPEPAAPETSTAETSETVPEPVAAPTLDEKLDALLGETPAGDEYRESKHCLRRSAYRRVEIINQEFLLFSKQGTYYLNRLKRKCPGLRRNLLLTFTMRGNSVCRSDIVYVSDRFGSSFRATCHLGEFELIEEQQALALKAAL